QVCNPDAPRHFRCCPCRVIGPDCISAVTKVYSWAREETKLLGLSTSPRLSTIIKPGEWDFEKTDFCLISLDDAKPGLAYRLCGCFSKHIGGTAKLLRRTIVAVPCHLEFRERRRGQQFFAHRHIDGQQCGRCAFIRILVGVRLCNHGYHIPGDGFLR